MLPSLWMAAIVAKKMQMQKGDGHREGKMSLIRLLSIVKTSVLKLLTVLRFQVKTGIDLNMKSIYS